ncbi:MAG TPA: hypothetical protein PKK06_01995 [Phycisphaerae bacterium]|nr:hypothetical protein [Phycisphaerae bacterium]HNU44103.1 hypothetical protein [Phycisphaerae bacterium]
MRSVSGLKSAFWAGLFLIHTVGVWSAWVALQGGVDEQTRVAVVVRLISLLASNVFFALKIADVRCLRLKPGWQSMVATTVAIGLLHVGAIGEAADLRVDCNPAPLGVVLFVGALCDTDLLRRTLRGWAAALAPGCRRATGLDAEPLHRTGAWLWTWQPAPLNVPPAYAGPRAPPRP